MIGRSACSASRSSSAARWTLWVPMTTSTWPARSAHAVLVLLRQAAGHDDLAAVLLALPRLQVPEVAVQLVVGVLADAARVEDDHVGVVLGVGARRARPPRADRRSARNRARSSGTRRCERDSAATWHPRLTPQSNESGGATSAVGKGDLAVGAVGHQRVVDDLPQMPVGIGDVRRVPAPEHRLGRLRRRGALVDPFGKRGIDLVT